jgi:hypothetical protein
VSIQYTFDFCSEKSDFVGRIQTSGFHSIEATSNLFP